MSNFSSPKARRTSSTPHYQTFSTPPPKSAGRPLSAESGSTNPSSSHIAGERTDAPTSTPIPIQQMSVLAFIALCEQTALNSISPYLPAMAASFPEVESHEVGIYVGTIASAFALAQFSTNFFGVGYRTELGESLSYY